MFKHSHRIFKMSLTILVIITSIYSSTLHTLYNQNPVAEASSQKTCNWKWRVVPSPNSGTKNNSLRGLVTIGANDIWAVGMASGANDSSHTLIEHWDGETWSIVPSPSANTGSSILLDISAIDASDIWAVGYVYENFEFRALLEHWDGSAWSMVTPALDLNNVTLRGVAAIASDNVWAVGGQTSGSNTPNHPLVLHWDGTEWIKVQVLDPSPYGYLNGIVALGADNIWAVGAYTDDAPPAVGNTLVMHYDGLAWNQVPSPNKYPGQHDNGLLSVAASTDANVWAVGFHRIIHPGPIMFELIEQWDGTEWALGPGAFDDKYVTKTNSIAVASSGEVWVVGQNRTALIEYRDDGVWKDVSPNNGYSELFDVATVDADRVWAVGHIPTGLSQMQTLIIQGRLQCSQPVQCLDAPVLLDPKPGMVVNSIQVRLDWKDQRCATHYQVQVRQKSPQGKVELREKRDRVSEYMFSRSSLDSPNRFVWRVRACNQQGCGEWSEWSKFNLQSTEIQTTRPV